MTVWVVGSLNQDLQLEMERHPRTGETVLTADLVRRFGGKGANQAVAAARQTGAGTHAEPTRTVMVGAVGDDEAGTAYRDRLQARGVEVDAVRVVEDSPTGTAVICVDAAGDNMIMVSPGANLQLRTEDVTTALADLADGDIVLLQLEIDHDVVVETIRWAAERGARVVANLAPYADLPPEVLVLCDPVVVNEHEHAQLRRSGLDCPSLLVTLGTEGSTWGEVHVAARTVEVVDTTGAGDAFCGALAAALAQGADRQSAMVVATRAAADCVQHVGAQA